MLLPVTQSKAQQSALRPQQSALSVHHKAKNRPKYNYERINNKHTPHKNHVLQNTTAYWVILHRNHNHGALQQDVMHDLGNDSQNTLTVLTVIEDNELSNSPTHVDITITITIAQQKHDSVITVV